jgi:hypothetical protein
VYTEALVTLPETVVVMVVLVVIVVQVVAEVEALEDTLVTAGTED